jgi:protein SCO1/2
MEFEKNGSFGYNRIMNRWFKILIGAAGLIAAGVLWFTLARPIVVLPRQRLAPGYGLQDAAGKLVTSEDARGLLTLYSFAYTRCEAKCAPIYASLQGLDGLLAQRDPISPRLRFITLSLDPAHDTPEQLAQFNAPFKPKTVEWLWLTGTKERMRSVIGEGFEMFFRAEADGSVTFAPRFILVDGFGVVRGVYEGAEQDPKRLLYELDLLLKEIAQSSGNARLAYEAAHFFACYPH